MTQQEFSKGWKLLILQPWGWRYRSLTAEGNPSEESKTQLEFYFSQLKFGHAEAWMKTAALFAAGEQWPAVKAVRETLSFFHRRATKALTDQTPETYVAMPDDLRDKLQADGILKTVPTDGAHALEALREEPST